MSRVIGKCLIVAAVVGALVGSVGLVTRARADKAAPIGAYIAQLPVTQIEGSPLDMAAGKGWKALYFWSDSCPCVKRCEQVNFIPLSKQYQGQVSFYGVAANTGNIRYRAVSEQGKNVELPLLRVAGGSGFWPPYPVVVDARHKVADLLGATFTPEVFLLNPDNQLVFRGVPDDSREYEERTGKRGLTENYLQDALEEALAGKKVSRPMVQPKGFCAIDRSGARSK
ncbi:MAG: hypothetical protein ACO1SX_13140 [Actinomycetota bacterium]